MITDDQMLMLWRTLHPVDVALDWGLYFSSLLILIVLFIRFRLAFLLLFAAGVLVLLAQAVPNHFYPEGDARPVFVGCLIECLRFVGSALQVAGVLKFVQWFVKTRNQPQQPG